MFHLYRHTLFAILTAALFATSLLGGSARFVQADVVTDWNAIAVQALGAATPPRPGPVIFLDLAIVQAAVHDAVQAIDKRFEPYHVTIANASGSPVAAAAKAAHDVLVNILPGQATTLGTQYTDYLTSQGLSATNPGVTVGRQAAAGILDLRKNDGRVPNPLPLPFIGGTAPGQWRPTPSNPPEGPPPLKRPDGDTLARRRPSLHPGEWGPVPRQSAAVVEQ